MKRLTGVLRSDIALIALTFALAAALAPAGGSARSTPTGIGAVQSDQRRAMDPSDHVSKGMLEQNPVKPSLRRPR